MKVLVISNYREKTGYSAMARNYIMAMHTAGIDVVIRNITFNEDNIIEVDEIFDELENKNIRNCDICIQITLPEYFVYNGHFKKNIGVFCYETNNFIASQWSEKINLMDEIWVPCNDMFLCCQNSNVTTPIHIVPVPCDTSKYYSYYEDINLPIDNYEFKLYFIGELIKRKNLENVLLGYYLEFEPWENVSLVLKVNKSKFSEQQCVDYIQSMVNEIHKKIKIYKNTKFKSPLVIASKLSEHDMLRLHKTCDCLVAPSYGESWGLHVFDAMCFGNTPIATNCGGPKDFLNSNDGPCGYLLSASHTNVEDEDFHDRIYTGYEMWYSTNIQQIRKYMRLATENNDIRKEMANNGINRAVDFSYSEIGRKIREILED